MQLTQILFKLDCKFKRSSTLNYENDELFYKLLEYNNNALIAYIEEYSHLVNKVLIVKNNITVPTDIRGKVYLISNYIRNYLLNC